METENSQFFPIDRPWVYPTAHNMFIDGNSHYGSLNALNRHHLSIEKSGTIDQLSFKAGVVRVDFPLIGSMPSDVDYRFCYDIRGNISLSQFSTLMRDSEQTITNLMDPIKPTQQFVSHAVGRLLIMPTDSISAMDNYFYIHPDSDPIQYLDSGSIPYTMISTFNMLNDSTYQQTLQQMVYSTDNQAYVLPRGYSIAYIYQLCLNSWSWALGFKHDLTVSQLHVECDIFAQLEMNIRNVPKDDTEAS